MYTYFIFTGNIIVSSAIMDTHAQVSSVEMAAKHFLSLKSQEFMLSHNCTKNYIITQ